MKSPQVFVREATGLVRELGSYDAFLINMAIINIAGGLTYDILQLFFFPGASMPLVFLLGGIPAIGVFIVYTIFSSAFPRSGGDYLYVSRILHPAIGFAQGMLTVLGFFVFGVAAFFAWYVVAYYVPSFLVSMTVTTADPSYAALATLISTNTTVAFGISTLLLVLAALVALFGLRVFRLVFRIVYSYYFLGAIIFAVVLFASTREAFVSALNAYAGSGAYESVLTNAGEYGTFTFSWTQTLLAFVPLGFLTFSGFQQSTFLGGEIKRPRSSQALGMGMAMIVTWIYLVALAYQSVVVFGDSFLQGVSYLTYTNAALIPFQGTPFVTFLVTFVFPNPIIAFLVNSTIIVGTWTHLPNCMMAASRVLFSQSFDRALPESMSKVSERLHSPVNAVLLMLVLMEIWVVVLYFAGYIAGYLTVTLAMPVTWGITAVAAILFPYIKKDLYNRSTKELPRWMQAKPAGIPLLTIGGIILLITMIIWAGALFSPIVRFLYLGPLIGSALGFTGGIFIAAFFAYYAVRAYRLRREGVDISIAFTQIPPE